MMNIELQDFLKKNMDSVGHANQRTLAQHSIAVSKLLETAGASQDTISAGLFHSVYGREFTNFNAISFQARSEIKKLIGEKAEELCYLNCSTSHASFWENFIFKRFNNPVLTNRFTAEKLEIQPSQLLELLNINFSNMVDHIAHSENPENYKWAEHSLFIQNFDYLLSFFQNWYKDYLHIK